MDHRVWTWFGILCLLFFLVFFGLQVLMAVCVIVHIPTPHEVADLILLDEGRLLLSSGADVRLWDVATGKVEVIEPVSLDLSAFDVELDPKRVPTFGSIPDPDDPVMATCLTAPRIIPRRASGSAARSAPVAKHPGFATSFDRAMASRLASVSP